MPLLVFAPQGWSEDNFEVVPSIHCVGLRDQTQVLRVDNRRLHCSVTLLALHLDILYFDAEHIN